MNIVRIEGYACGYYSESEWEEYVYLTEEGYDKVSGIVDNLEIYIYELDGKHSQTEAGISTELVKEDDVERYEWNDQYDGYKIFENICDEVKKQGIDIDLEADRKMVTEYLNGIDKKIKREVVIKESQLADFEKCIKDNFDGYIIN